MSEFEAVVSDCVQMDDGYGIILDKTALYPVGGGQPSDTGFIGGVQVTSVFERGGVIIHMTGSPLPKGADVSCAVNMEDRFPLMQEHTGEHILSGIIKKMYGLNNVGFRMGSEYVTIDIDGVITADQLRRAEEAANEAVYKNITVESMILSPDRLKSLDFRSKREFDEDVRIVSIGGYDRCACCGTHVRATGEIGVIKTIEWQKYKKGMRLFMLCGRRGLADYADINGQVHDISGVLSAKRVEVAEAVRRLAEENAALKQRLHTISAERLTRIAEAARTGSDVVCLFEDGLTAGDISKLCADLCEKARVAAVLSGESGGYRYAVGSKHLDIRPFVAELNGRFCGKGGGGNNLAGGSLSGQEADIRAFLANYYQ